MADDRMEPKVGGPGPVGETKERVDPLARALAIQEAAAEVGFDWGEVAGPLAKLREEIAEVEGAIDGEDPTAIEEELGDLLFSMVNVARLAGHNPSMALVKANAKFERRFREVKRLALERGVRMPGSTLEEMDLLWDEVKRGEKPMERRIY